MFVFSILSGQKNPSYNNFRYLHLNLNLNIPSDFPIKHQMILTPFVYFKLFALERGRKAKRFLKHFCYTQQTPMCRIVQSLLSAPLLHISTCVPRWKTRLNWAETWSLESEKKNTCRQKESKGCLCGLYVQSGVLELRQTYLPKLLSHRHLKSESIKDHLLRFVIVQGCW